MTITPVTPAQFEKLKAELATQAKVTADTITGHGVTANYRYDATAQLLTVDVVKKPFYVPIGVIEGQLRESIIKIGA